MGAKSGFALKLLQWFIRGIQFCCAAIILGVFSYFLAALNNHDLPIANDVRAVEGISGAAVLYTLIGLLLLCCFAGVAAASLIAIILDVCFIGAFIYVAVVNRGGAGSCSGYLDTPFGSGRAGDTTDRGTDGFTNLPSFHTACRLETACLAVAIIAIFFFVLSILMEVALVRHHRKDKRYGPSPANNYTSGRGRRVGGGGGGMFGRLLNRNKKNQGPEMDENALPAHPQPSQLGSGGIDGRQSYATETTAVGSDPAAVPANPYAPDHAKYEAGYPYPQHQQSGVVPQGPTHPHDYRYEDGVFDRNAQ